MPKEYYKISSYSFSNSISQHTPHYSCVRSFGAGIVKKKKVNKALENLFFFSHNEILIIFMVVKSNLVITEKILDNLDFEKNTVLFYFK